MSLEKNELKKKKRRNRSYPFTKLLGFMFTYIYVCVCVIKDGVDMRVNKGELLWVCHNWEYETNAMCTRIAKKSNYECSIVWVVHGEVAALPPRKMSETQEIE